MAPDGQTAGGLAANNGSGLRHFRGDVLKAYGHLITNFIVILGYPIQQMGGGVVPYAGTLPAPVFQQIVVQQHQQGVGVEERTVFVNDAQPVSVAVGSQAQVAVVLHHIIAQQPQSIRTGGGHSAAEQSVMLLVDHVHIAAAGHQDGSQTALADAVHGVNGDAQPGSADSTCVDHLEDAVDILVEGIALGDDALGHGVGIVDALDIRRVNLADFVLDLLGDDLVRVPAALNEDLDAVVNGGVVAGGDGHAIGQLQLLDGEHDQGGGDAAVDDQGTVAIPCQNLCGPEHGFLGQEAPVIA